MFVKDLLVVESRVMPATTSAIPINPPHANRYYSMNGDLDLHRVHVAGGDLDGLEMPAASPSDDMPSGSIETVNFAECGKRPQFNGGPSSTPVSSSGFSSNLKNPRAGQKCSRSPCFSTKISGEIPAQIYGTIFGSLH